uniref:GPAT/DHAPAT C-terminal domain-containing protein n=1 Tax=Amphiprion ocellaris TaxID=80972 RepID=A0AAQ5ZB78_AMPOC
KFRPIVNQCCHRCTPDSLNLGQNSSLGFRNLLSVNETQTRYRGWLVRRVCFALFVSGRKVYESPVSNRLERLCQSNRVREALTAEHEASEGGDGQGQLKLLSPYHALVNTCISSGFLRFVGWAVLKMFASVFYSIEVNLNHLSALHRVSQEGSPLVYVYVRQSIMDYALIPLVLFCHNLRVPYTVYPLSILQKVGVILLPPSAQTEQDAEMDSLYSPVMTSLVRELLHEGQAISVGVSPESGQGGQWLARVIQIIKERSVPDVRVVPVGISYDCVPKTNIQVDECNRTLARTHLTREMCESRRCRVEEWLPLQDLLLPVILNNRTENMFGKRRMSWLLPSSHYASELEEPGHPDRNLSMAIIHHLIFSATSCMAVMATSAVSSLLLYRRRKGVSVSGLCRDVDWLIDEVLLRNRDVGFGGTLANVIHYSLALLGPHLIIAAVPSRKDPFIVPRPSFAATLHLFLQAQTVTHTFILEAVGACAVSAMLCEVAFSGVKEDMEFDVVLCQSNLTERALQLCHLLPPGFMPPCQSSQNFALDAVDSLVRCGILIIEEIPRDVPICDFWKKDGILTWTTTDDPYHSDSDCEEQDLRSYKIRQPSRCPEMLFFLCSMLAGHLRALCWTTMGLDHIDTPLASMCIVCSKDPHCAPFQQINGNLTCSRNVIFSFSPKKTCKDISFCDFALKLSYFLKGAEKSKY